MNKLFTKIVGTCLGLAMAVGTGVAVAAGASKEAAPVHATSGNWDLTTESYDSASASSMVFSNTGVTVEVTQNGGTAVNNYCPPSNSQTRFYKKNVLTVTPKSGYQVNSFSITATTAGYQKWTAGSNCSGTTTTATLTVTPSTKTSAFTLTTTATGRYTSMSVDYEVTSSDPVTYTGVTVSEKSALVGTYKGDAYYECQASVSGTGSYSSSVTWSITSSNTYGAGTTIADKASIDANGKITFLDNCTVYVWATAADGTTHNTSGFSVTASALQDNPISSWTKVTSTSNVSSSKVYALSNDQTNFAGNSVSSSQLELTTSLNSIG